MRRLSQAKLGLTYFLVSTAEEAKLKELGFVKGKKVELVNLTDQNAIVVVAGSRIAMGRETIDNIFVNEVLDDKKIVDLSNLKTGETGVVQKIESDIATKHRLMDMGITRGVAIYVRKLSPLGDPMELHLRGYSLSLRKQDARLIKVLVKEV